MNQSMHNDDLDYFSIPESRAHIAQYLLIYESGDPNEDLSDLKTSDERHMRITIRVKNQTSKNMFKLVNSIREELKTNYPSLDTEMTGGLMLMLAQTIHLLDGLVLSFTTAFLTIGLCFVIVFRSLKYGLLGMIPSVFPISVAGTLMVLFDISLDMGTMIVAAMTMGIAVDDSIHMMTRYIEERKRNHTRIDSVDAAMKESGRAVILTTLILVGGFSIMMGASFIPMMYMGLFSALILFTALLADLIYLPALIFLREKSKVVKGQALAGKLQIA
jgi:predicted RND superfamily exporter protein